ncbi:hypothetical protein KF728_25230 [Candidatus Obscuribacterales bacterium]|nr:hypothetical protein [Candidatus Obscuribacterales bacterium]
MTLFIRKTALLVLILVASCAPSVLPMFAQDGLTPPPPRPRRAYSTIDNYNYSHGGDVAVEQTRKPRKKKPKKAVVKPTEPVAKTEKVERNDDTLKKATSAGKDQKTEQPAAQATKQIIEQRAPQRTEQSAPQSTHQKTQQETQPITPPESQTTSKSTTTVDQTTSDSVDLSAAKLSEIPGPQMPPPPTSIGGFTMKTSTTR